MPVTQTNSGALRDSTARWRSATTRRVTVLLAIIGMVTGAGLLTAGLGLAAVGTGPGQLVLTPATGPLTTQATWSTTTGCPSGNSTSAAVYEYTLTGTQVSLISN